jgi:adenylate cyclase
MRFKNTGKSMREIARELGVGAILEGSIQKEGNEIRVNVKLIRGADDAHLWAGKYDRKLESVFRVQDEISMAIAEALKLKLTSQEKQGIAKQPIDNAAAYECYLKACREIRRFDERGLDRALQNLQNGLAIIGDNALLYVGMAFACYQYANIGTKQEEYIEKSDMYAKKALALDPNCAQAYFALGINSSAFRGNQQEAVRYYKKALKINPNYASALHSLGNTYLYAGKNSLAAALMNRYRQLDPLNAMIHSYQQTMRLFDGEYELALEYGKMWFEAAPANPLAQYSYAVALVYNGENHAAISIIDKAAAATPDNVATKFGLILKYALLNNREKIFEILTPDFQKTCIRDFEWSYNVAASLSLLGAKKEALDWLENAINQGFLNYRAMERDLFLGNIRGEERFKKLMERAKFESDHFEV